MRFNNIELVNHLNEVIPLTDTSDIRTTILHIYEQIKTSKNQDTVSRKYINFKQKYMKYKTKYLELKKKLENNLI